MPNIRTFSQFGIVIFVFYLVYFIYVGIINPIPALGDSWDYHIPISKLILNGSFLHPEHVDLPQWYYPGSAESINSLLIFLHIPLTLSNILAIFVLFFCCWKLGSRAALGYYESIFFACVVVTLNVFVRWYNAVSVDVWVTIFFILGIILLEKPKSTSTYFLKLGLVLGMLVGSKFSGWYLLLGLMVVYFNILKKQISVKAFVVFLVPFSILGLSWYIRNFFLFSNPFYPLILFGLPGKIAFPVKVWSLSLSHPKELLDAVFSEYKFWIFSVPLAFIIFVKRIKSKELFPLTIFTRILLLGLVSFVVLLISPSENQSWIMVSSMRYSYSAFILFILMTFIVAKRYNFLDRLALLSIASMIIVLSFAYYPKLVLVYGPVSIIVIYLIDHYKKNIAKYLN